MSYPHCDARVLHAPQDCEYCDLHPDWQELREVWGINFTGRYEEGKVLCPSEQARGIGGPDVWGGNVPSRGYMPTEGEVIEATTSLLSLHNSLVAKQITCCDCHWYLLGNSGAVCALDRDPIYDEATTAASCENYEP